MKKLLRLDDIARGGRGRGEVFDLLGLRVVVSPNEGIPLEDGEAMAAQVSQLYALCCLLPLPHKLLPWEKAWRADRQCSYHMAEDAVLAHRFATGSGKLLRTCGIRC